MAAEPAPPEDSPPPRPGDVLDLHVLVVGGFLLALAALNAGALGRLPRALLILPGLLPVLVLTPMVLTRWHDQRRDPRRGLYLRTNLLVVAACGLLASVLPVVLG